MILLPYQHVVTGITGVVIYTPSIYEICFQPNLTMLLLWSVCIMFVSTKKVHTRESLGFPTSDPLDVYEVQTIKSFRAPNFFRTPYIVSVLPVVLLFENVIFLCSSFFHLPSFIVASLIIDLLHLASIIPFYVYVAVYIYIYISLLNIHSLHFSP